MAGLKGMLAIPLKSGGDDKEEEADEYDSYAKEAFQALKDDDEEGFKTAFLGAIKACMRE